MTHFLTRTDLNLLLELVKTKVQKRGNDFYSWKNSPEGEDLNHFHEVYSEKLDGVYGER